MKKRLVSIHECLFDAFSNSEEFDPQEPRQMWALHEGIGRIDPQGLSWRSVKARKAHKCIRGCEIRQGHTYFKHLVYGGWGADWKFCAGCMAMILYFYEVEKLPRYWSTHWDPEAEEPIRVKEE